MTGVGAEGRWSSVTVQLFPRSPTSVFAHSACLCTQVPQQRVFILLPRESTCFPIHLHTSFAVPLPHGPAALSLQTCACIHLSGCQINSSLHPSLQLLWMPFPAQHFNYILKNRVK